MKLPDYSISDTHFTDPIIAEHFGRYSPSQPSLEDIDGAMVKNWNGVVGVNYRSVIHVGDLLFGPRREEAEYYVNKLIGKKILVKGNHDKQSNSYYEDLGFEVHDYIELYYNGFRVLFTHKPLKGLLDTDINIHGHIHNAANDFITAAHINVCVEQHGFAPRKTAYLLDRTIYRLKFIGESADRDRDLERVLGLSEER